MLHNINRCNPLQVRLQRPGKTHRKMQSVFIFLFSIKRKPWIWTVSYSCMMLTALYFIYVVWCRPTTLSTLCVYCVTNLWNECFIITDEGLSETTNYTEANNLEWIWYKEDTEHWTNFIWIGYLLLLIMTTFVIHDDDFNHSLDLYI